MNEEEKNKAITFLEKKKSIRACDCCGQNSWSLSKDIVTTPMLVNSNIAIGGKSYPYLMLICNNCGNTKFFNAVKMGILSSKEKASDE